ncbi:MAG: transcriptional regulator GcvA [bacterium]
MSIRFPPISALRALESAARHLSYTRAAEELFVTQSAISHQIKHAEELWELKLFEKRGRRIVLTEAGHALVPVVRDFIRRITLTLEDLGEKNEGPAALRVTLLQSFAFKWLVHRLGHFNQDYPGIDVWISTSDNLVDFDAENADVGIRLGYGNWSNLHEELLLTEYVFPVCSPRFAEQHPIPEAPAKLLEMPLLRRSAVDICPRWRDWFRDAGVRVNKMPAGGKFPQTSLAVQAAIDHQGIALARSAHVLDDLNAGRLIRLFPQVLSRSSVSYYFVCMPDRETEPQIAAFREWLLRETNESQKEFDQMMHAPQSSAKAKCAKGKRAKSKRATTKRATTKRTAKKRATKRTTKKRAVS